MTKAELVDKIAEKKPGLTRKQVEVIVNTVLDGIKDALSREDKVEIRGFGSFRIRHRRAKEGRNPKTGETVQVPPRKVPFFKAGKEMRELVDKIAEKKPGLTRKQVEIVVNTVLDGIKDALSREDKVEIRGFGSFRVRHRRAKEGRNPKTGETVSVPPKKVPFFKAGKEMREMVDGKI